MEAHLAQFNIATLRHPMDHPETAGFVALLRGEQINLSYLQRAGLA